MAETPNKLREVAWAETCPWLILFRSVRIALMARVLVLGAVGLIVTALGWQVIDLAFSASDDPVVDHWRTGSEAWLWKGASSFEVYMSARSAEEVLQFARSGITKAPQDVWLYLTQPFRDLFDARLTVWGFIFLLLCCVWELLVWGLVGGAITRIAALKFTRDESLGLIAALRHSSGKILSYCVAPLIALAGAAVFGVQLFVLGLIMNAGILAAVAGVLWIFVLVLGLLMAVLLIGALVGWPLMWATVAVEGTDAFDALSRSYAYVYQRPWRLLWYVIFAFFLAVVSMFVVKAFAASAIALGDWSIDWGLNDEKFAVVVSEQAESEEPANIAPPFPQGDEVGGLQLPQPDETVPDDTESDSSDEPTGLESFSHGAVHFWKRMLAAVVAGYQAGFLWVAGVGVYLLLRRDVDGAEMDEVFVEQQEEYGMPPLEEDASTGVPEVAPEGTAQPGDVEGEKKNDE